MAVAGPTFQNVIQEALAHLGVYTGDDVLDASDLAAAFSTLCDIIDGYGAQALTIVQHSIFQFSTIANQQSYTLGPAGTNNWVTASLPPDFSAMTMLSGPGPGAIEYEIAMLTSLEWALGVPIKSMASPILLKCWAEMGAASHVLNFWPVPSVSQLVNLYVPQVVAVPTAVSNSFIAARGLKELLQFELAIKCSAKFRAVIPEWLPVAWQEARTNFKATNFASDALYARCDAALLGKSSMSGGGSISFYTGE